MPTTVSACRRLARTRPDATLEPDEEAAAGAGSRTEGAAMIWIGAMALTACMFVSPQHDEGGLPAVDGHAFFNLPEFCACCHETGEEGQAVEPHGFTVEITETCLRCHSASKIGASHPVDVDPAERYPDMVVPEEIPVGRQARTPGGPCHNPHLAGAAGDPA